MIERNVDLTGRDAARSAPDGLTLSEIQRPERTHADPPYLKPVLGCLRRNRRRLFAAAVTRYLKSVYAAVVADTGDFPRRQANKRPATEGDEEAGRRLTGSGAISARDLACNQRTPGHRWQAVRRAGPPAARAPEAARQKRRSGTWELLRRATKCPWPGADRPGSPYPCASSGLARDAAAETCLRRRNTRLPGIICRRLQITAVLLALCC